MFITQSIADLYNSPSGEAIAKNSQTNVILSQLPQAIEQIRNDKSLVLSEYGYDMLTTIKTVKGQYSELYFLTPMGEGVGRLIVDRFTQILYSTDPNEKSAVRSLVAKGYSTSEAIKEIIKNEQRSNAA